MSSSPAPGANQQIIAVVVDVCGSGKKRYAVTSPSNGKSLPQLAEGETITFSLNV